jgi:plasmid stabilization system protein ParE
MQNRSGKHRNVNVLPRELPQHPHHRALRLHLKRGDADLVALLHQTQCDLPGDQRLAATV